jgi:hypothetical protein
LLSLLLACDRHHDDSKTPTYSGYEQYDKKATKPDATFFGLYAISRRLDDPSKKLEDAVYALPKLDGVYVQALWGTLEPKEGNYDWTTLDVELDRAAAHDKKVSLSVAAGDATPKWIFAAGAKKLEFVVAHHAAGGDAVASDCKTIDLAAPWDPVFLAKYGAFIDALGKHVASSKAKANVRVVKIEGINEFSSELRLPSVPGGEVKGCALTDCPKKWLSAMGGGYRPKKIIEAFRTLANDWAKAFPDAELGIEILEAGAFPPIDDEGKKQKDDLTPKLIDVALEIAPGRVEVQTNALTATIVTPEVTAAGKRGAKIGYQTNDWLKLDGAGCDAEAMADAKTCTEKTFGALLDRGVKLGAKYIEIFPYDATTFPKALAATHDALTK